MIGSLAWNSSAGALVGEIGWIILSGAALEVSGGADGIGGAGSAMNGGGGGGGKARTCSTTGGGGTRKRKAIGPACGNIALKTGAKGVKLNQWSSDL